MRSLTTWSNSYFSLFWAPALFLLLALFETPTVDEEYEFWALWRDCWSLWPSTNWLDLFGCRFWWLMLPTEDCSFNKWNLSAKTFLVWFFCGMFWETMLRWECSGDLKPCGFAWGWESWAFCFFCARTASTSSMEVSPLSKLFRASNLSYSSISWLAGYCPGSLSSKLLMFVLCGFWYASR